MVMSHRISSVFHSSYFNRKHQYRGGKWQAFLELQKLARLKIGKSPTFVDLVLSCVITHPFSENLLNIQGMENASFIQAYYKTIYM